MVQSNLQPPALPRACVLRPRLLAGLDDGASTGLVLVTGVAGAGKSTLVLQWLASRGEDAAVAWLTLDPHDNDPHRFWSHLGGAVRRARPEFVWEPGDSDRAGPGGELPDAVSLVDALGSLGTPLVLVIDDVHVVVEETVLRGLELLAGADLPDVVLVLVTRVRPDIRLQRRAASRGLVEITGAELMLTAAETAGVLVARGLDPEWTPAVQRATGGWPVAVSLTTRLAPGDVPFDPGTIRRARRDIGRYLTEEILRSQPPEVQRFLLDSCILDEISTAGANAVRGSTDAASLLEYLDRHDLFVSVVDAGTTDERWRHHAVVRDHLRSRLCDHEPDRWTELHRRAGAHFADRDVERAVGHYLAAGDHERAADLIEGLLAVESGHWAGYETRLRWYEALPDAVVAARAALRANGIHLALMVERSDLAARWVRGRSVDRASSIDDLAAESWQAAMVGDLPRIGESCALGLEICGATSPWYRPMLVGKAAAELAREDRAAALASLLPTLVDIDSAPSETYPAQEMVRAVVSALHAATGDIEAARWAVEDTAAWVRAAESKGYTSAGVVPYAEAMLAFYRGAGAAAASWTSPLVITAVGGRPFLIAAHIDRARTRRAVGDQKGAHAALQQAAELIARLVDPGGLEVQVADELALLKGAASSRSSHVPAPALTFYEPLSQREQEVLRLLRSEYSLPEIAGHLFVSYNTAKTHTKTIYRKLGVRTRSSAVARARDLGYLDRPRPEIARH